MPHTHLDALRALEASSEDDGICGSMTGLRDIHHYGAKGAKESASSADSGATVKAIARELRSLAGALNIMVSLYKWDP